MSSATAASRLSTVLDGLVSDARSTRDGVFNTLDAVDRQTTLSSQSLARQVQRFCAERAASARARRAAAGAPRDVRFDPEDEWDLPARTLSTNAASVTSAGDAAVLDDDTDNYPESWLR